MTGKFFTTLNIVAVILSLFFVLNLNYLINTCSASGYTGNFSDSSGLKQTGEPAGFYTNIANEDQTAIENIFARVIAIALSLIGMFFFILMLYSGYLWLMSKGDTKDIDKAKENIKHALIGIIVVLGAYAITKILVPVISTWVTAS